MRRDLRGCLLLLAPRETGQLRMDGAPDERSLPIAERIRIWDLAIKLGRELGTEVDAPAPEAPREGGPPRTRRADFG